MIERIPIRIDNQEPIFVEATERTTVEFVVVCKSGNVYLVDPLSRQPKLLGKLNFPLTYSKDFFKYSELTSNEKAFLQIKSHGNYVSITQKFGLSGVVFNLGDSRFSKELHRGDYCAEHCTFPIAFYSEDDSTFLIHGTDWNRLDITHLQSDKLRTERVVEYRTNSNYFDYFHSSLSVSPDSKYFTSNGWVWGPCDVITVYSLSECYSKYELAHTSLNFEPVDGYNWDRPMCWIDNRTIGVGYNRREDDENVANFPSEIIFVDVLLNEITNRIAFDGFALSQYGAAEGELFYDAERNWFIGLNNQSGLVVSDMKGIPLNSDNSLRAHKYSPKHRILYQLDHDSHTIEIMKIH